MCALYMSEGMLICSVFHLCWKYYLLKNINKAFSSISENVMKSSPMLLFDHSSLWCDL